MIKKIDHIAVVVGDLEDEIKKYREILGLTFLGSEVVAEQKVRVALFDVGGVRLELMEPTAPDSPVYNFLKKRGGGIHHLACRVDDLNAQIDVMQQAGIAMIDNQPRTGAGGSKIAFADPKGFSGVLLELVESGE